MYPLYAYAHFFYACTSDSKCTLFNFCTVGYTVKFLLGLLRQMLPLRGLSVRLHECRLSHVGRNEMPFGRDIFVVPDNND